MSQPSFPRGQRKPRQNPVRYVLRGTIRHGVFGTQPRTAGSHPLQERERCPSRPAGCLGSLPRPGGRHIGTYIRRRGSQALRRSQPFWRPRWRYPCEGSLDAVRQASHSGMTPPKARGHNGRICRNWSLFLSLQAGRPAPQLNTSKGPAAVVRQRPAALRRCRLWSPRSGYPCRR
jgi:hypothetical protein